MDVEAETVIENDLAGKVNEKTGSLIYKSGKRTSFKKGEQQISDIIINLNFNF